MPPVKTLIRVMPVFSNLHRRCNFFPLQRRVNAEEVICQPEGAAAQLVIPAGIEARLKFTYRHFSHVVFRRGFPRRLLSATVVPDVVDNPVRPGHADVTVLILFSPLRRAAQAGHDLLLSQWLHGLTCSVPPQQPGEKRSSHGGTRKPHAPPERTECPAHGGERVSTTPLTATRPG